MSAPQVQSVGLRRSTYERLLGYAGGLQQRRTSRVTISEAVDDALDKATDANSADDSPEDNSERLNH